MVNCALGVTIDDVVSHNILKEKHDCVSKEECVKRIYIPPDDLLM